MHYMKRALALALAATTVAAIVTPSIASAHAPTHILTGKALVQPAKALDAAAFRPFGQNTVARIACDGSDGNTYFGSSFRIGGEVFTAGHIAYPCGYSYSATHDYSKFAYPSRLGLRSLPRERAYVGQRVQMVGMPGTGNRIVSSSGTVIAMHKTARVSWPLGAVISETNQLVIRGWAAAGMSGGAILAPDGGLVGMIDWGSKDGRLAGGSPASDLR
jgi:Trypsin-like peptidase domain